CVVTLEPVEPKRARALLASLVREREQPAQVLVAGVRLDQQRQHGGLDLFRVLAQRQLGPDDHALVYLAPRSQGSDRSVQAVTIAKRDGLQPELFGAHHHLFGMGGTSEKRERGATEELREHDTEHAISIVQ